MDADMIAEKLELDNAGILISITKNTKKTWLIKFHVDLPILSKYISVK